MQNEKEGDLQVIFLIFNPASFLQQCNLVGVKNIEPQPKRGPGRPRKYTASAPQGEEEGPSENKPIEVNILSIQAEESMADQAGDSETTEVSIEVSSKDKVNLGQVLELAVQSMSVTMEPEEEEEEEEATNKIEENTVTVELTAEASAPEVQSEPSAPSPIASPAPATVEIPEPAPSTASEPVVEQPAVAELPLSTTITPIPQPEESLLQEKIAFVPTEDDSDFEWKLDNEEDVVIQSPPTKKKKTAGSANVIVPTVSIMPCSSLVHRSKRVSLIELRRLRGGRRRWRGPNPSEDNRRWRRRRRSY